MATQPSQPQVLTELKLSPALKEVVNSALERGRMMSVAYVGPDQRPELSFRGSTQAFSDSQLAIWVRNPEGGILAAVRGGRPHISILYGEMRPDAKTFLSFRGRGHIETADAVRRAVYENSPQIERDMDKNRGGVALIIDLDSVDGIFGGAVLKMRR